MRKKHVTGRSNSSYLYLILSLLFADLLVLLFLKYRLNDLSFKDFSFDSLGNLLNIALCFLNAGGIIAISKVKKISPNLNQKPVLELIIFSALLHILILFHEYFHIGIPGFLTALTTSKRIYYTCLFILSQLIQFYILSLIITAFFGEKKFIYLKASFKMVFISVIFILFSFFYSVLKKHGEDSLKKGEYDTGVVLGAAVWQGNKPSPLFEGRIKKAYELYSQKVIKKIQLTGSNAPGEKSEAKTASDYLKKMGMNSNDLFIEEKSSNTVEQIAYLKRNFSEKSSFRKLVVISDEFHLVRALEICSFFKINAESSSSEYNITSEKLLYYRLRESAALLLFWFFAV